MRSTPLVFEDRLTKSFVESGEVIALLDIAKCLYDAIARMERAAEKGKAITAAVEGVEKQWGTSIAGPNTFIETLRDRMFRPILSTIIPENSKIATALPTDTVLMATKKMVEYGMSFAVVAVENKTRGILMSRDILMQVIAQNLPPESTPVEKVMTPNPECATVDTPIVDAVHIMHDGKFLHLPVVDKDGVAVAVVDVLHITHAAIATIRNPGGLTMKVKVKVTAMTDVRSVGEGEEHLQYQGSKLELLFRTLDASTSVFVSQFCRILSI